MIRYVSMTGGSDPVDFKQAILSGKADDGGFYVPDSLPFVSLQNLADWRSLDYTDLAFEILSLYIDDSIIPAQDLRKLIQDSFSTFSHSEKIPHTSLEGGIIVQELFHGPTLSFKDVAMGFVVNLFDYFLQQDGSKMNIIVATSGDTGPAAGHACIGKKSMNAWLLYPVGMITKEQEMQMTTIDADNVHTVAVEGCRNGSDDVDDLIQLLFADNSFREATNLSSVNSLNWGRIMMQTVHYFYGYLQNVDEVGEKMNFSVPSGAFGNMCAGIIAREMGLPVDNFIVATNDNYVLKNAFEKGLFSRELVKTTHSSAIDIAVPTNFWRFLYFVSGQNSAKIKDWKAAYDLNGFVQLPSDAKQWINEGMLSNSVTDEETLATINKIYKEEAYLLDPHSAVAVASAKKLLPHASKVICLATAHPAKFPEVIKLALEEMPKAAYHQSIELLKTLPTNAYKFTNENMGKKVPEIIQKVIAD